MILRQSSIRFVQLCGCILITSCRMETSDTPSGQTPLLADTMSGAQMMNSQLALPHHLYLADVDGDGVQDFVQFSATRIFVAHSDFDQTGVLHYYLPAPATRLVIGSFDGATGDQICAVMTNGSLSCYRISADHASLQLSFAQGTFIAADDDVLVGDYDGDGHADLMVYNSS